jgi:beta-phosphoglucomutase
MKKHIQKSINFKNKKAVLFDMDGVLVDSMPYHFISWFAALKHYGIRVTAKDVYSREGEKWDKSVKDFFYMAKKPLTPALMKEVFALRSRLFKKYFTPFLFEGIEDIVRLCKNKGYKLAVVTGSNASAVKKMLPKRLYGLFDTVIGGDMVKCGKPHPEPYLTAAKKLNVKPSECIVIENAPYGIQSAKSAKMYCIAAATSLPAAHLKQADIIINDIKKLSSYFGKASK